MKFRENFLKDKTEDTIATKYIEQFEKKFKLDVNENKEIRYIDIDRFFSEFSEDILVTKVLYLLKKNFDDNVYDKVSTIINEFDKIIMPQNFEGTLYFSKIIKNLTVENNLLKKDFDYYKSLKLQVDKKYPDYDGKQSKLRIGKIDEMLKKLEDNKVGFFESLCNEFTKEGLMSYVNKGSDELYRQALNVYLSKILGIYLNDNTKINKIGSQPLLYTEFRILVYIRNYLFNLNGFIQLIKDIRSDKRNYILDYTILDVVEYYVSFLRDPKYVDDLIQIHKYTNEIWKNGSKFLHFYTLHNHEHAIELIKAVTTFLKNVDYFQIGYTDYYIIFISCYLHDISMVLHPDLIKVFSRANNIDANLIISKFKDDLNNILSKNIYLMGSKELKELMISYYQKIDIFFENSIRNRHAKDSARFIRSTNDLGFINDAIKDIVAEVSEAHGFNVCDVYGVKSNARESLISKKYLKILLRIADLLDVSDNRVANAVLLNNNSHMSEVTIFHWLSHQAISNYEILTTYKNKFIDKDEKDENISYISKGAIIEKITIRFWLNIKYYISSNAANCEFCHSYGNDDGRVNLVINSKKIQKCLNSNCDFVCKWMVKKNKYLFEELFALRKYLSRSSSNFFETIFEVKFISNDDARLLSPEEYNEIKNFIERNNY